jgi:single-stranded-DNA-specific exonuclease
MFGAQIDYLVPNRFEYGYGLTPEIVELAAAQAGPADHRRQRHRQRRRRRSRERARHRRARHRPPPARRRAARRRAIVNPNQPGCAFPSKHIAGVGVMFYVLLALRGAAPARRVREQGREPRLDGLLDLVALGTVADVVRLDGNNRILVAQGLQRSATAACSRASPRCSAPRAATRAPRRASISASASARA